MISGWSDTNAKGQPLEAGTFCWVIDAEDGTHPIYTYGKSQEEVMQKVSRTAATAQSTLTRERQAATPPPPPRRRLSASRRAELMEELKDPAKYSAALRELNADETGIDPMIEIRDRFADLCQRWADDTPALYQHPGNIRNIATLAIRLAGDDLTRVTSAILDRAYMDLSRKGELFEAPASGAAPPAPSEPDNLRQFPDRHQVQPSERPRGRFATGARPTYRSPQSATPKKPAYTEEEIRTMPTAKRRELIESNDAAYAEACEYHFGTNG